MSDATAIDRHIGVLGGTFDPVHNGHLRTGVELLTRLRLDRMLFVPAGRPPHKDAPESSAGHRLRMLQLALRGDRRMQVDSRECDSDAVSYTLPTLAAMRRDWGDRSAISFCVGTDAFLGMHQWRHWPQLLDVAHIVVVARPGWCVPGDLGALELWRERIVSHPDALRQRAAGCIFFASLTPMAVSATELRALVAGGQSARYLLPDSVWRYIQRQGLYAASPRPMT